MALNFEPLEPWHLVITMLAVIAATLFATRAFHDPDRALGRKPWVRAAVVLLSCLAAALLAVAGWNPRLARRPDATRVHLSVAIDVSESVLREPEEDWSKLQEEAHDRLKGWIDNLPEQVQDQGTASILTFGEGEPNVVEDKIPLAGLPEALWDVDKSDFAQQTGSDLAAGLESSGTRIEQAGGQGAVALISDGNETVGEAKKTAAQLAQRGIPVHVLPVTSRNPEVAIASADLPRQVTAGVEISLRAVLRNSRTQGVTTTLSVEQNLGLEETGSRFMAAGYDPWSVSIPAGDWRFLPVPFTFTGPGLQYVDLALTPEGEALEHRRRFFTHVVEPPRILAIGDNRWASLVPADAFAVTVLAPTSLSPDVDLGLFDAVVVGSVPATEFAPESLTSLAMAVKEEGLGLMIINGGHEGADEEAATVLMTYDSTPVEDLLPVSSHPREEIEPPERQVVIVIDKSGSMTETLGQDSAGRQAIKIEKAKEIARYIVSELLRPQDRLHLITFTDGVDHLVKNEPMKTHRQQALDAIDGIGAGGGTVIEPVLGLMANLDLGECALILLSDGEFSPADTRPECRANVFDVGHEVVPPDSALRRFADPIGVGPDFDPANAQISSVEPEMRKKYFEPGEFVPRATGGPENRRDPLPVPALSLPGAAVTFRKDDIELASVRPRFADPVLAYRQAGKGYAGVFTSQIPEVWTDSEEAHRAVQAWIERILPYQARDRYDFRLVDQGDALDLQVALVSKQRRVPNVDYIDARIELGGQDMGSIELHETEDAPATYSGRVQLNRGEKAQPGVLVLEERGIDELVRPQRIPILIPPAGAVQATVSSEAASYGRNEALLRAIAEVGGGAYDPPPETEFFRGHPPANPGIPLWPSLVAVAGVAYLAAIALRRIEG